MYVRMRALSALVSVLPNGMLPDERREVMLVLLLRTNVCAEAFPIAL
jgi:hypothetical protein